MSQSAAQRVDVSTLQASRWKFSLNSRYLPPLFITTILVVGHFAYGILEITRERRLRLFVLWSLRWCWAGSFGKWINLASAYISGISVGILIRSPALWPYALCSVLSIMSKYVLRVKAIFGILQTSASACCCSSPDTIAALTVQWGILWPLLVIWILGSVIIWRANRIHISVTYVLSFFCSHSCAVGLQAITGCLKFLQSPDRCTSSSYSSWLRIRKRLCGRKSGSASSCLSLRSSKCCCD